MDATLTKKLEGAKVKMQEVLNAKAKLKEQERLIAAEIQQSVPEAEREKIIADVNKELAQAEEKFKPHKEAYDIALEKCNAILDLLQHRIKNSFGRTSRTVTISGDNASITHGGKTVNVKLAHNGEMVKSIMAALNCGDGVARNLAYQARKNAGMISK